MRKKSAAACRLRLRHFTSREKKARYFLMLLHVNLHVSFDYVYTFKAHRGQGAAKALILVAYEAYVQELSQHRAAGARRRERLHLPVLKRAVKADDPVSLTTDSVPNDSRFFSNPRAIVHLDRHRHGIRGGLQPLV